jgi:hypothetical protein
VSPRAPDIGDASRAKARCARFGRRAIPARTNANPPTPSMPTRHSPRSTNHFPSPHRFRSHPRPRGGGEVRTEGGCAVSPRSPGPTRPAAGADRTGSGAIGLCAEAPFETPDHLLAPRLQPVRARVPAPRAKIAEAAPERIFFGGASVGRAVAPALRRAPWRALRPRNGSWPLSSLCKRLIVKKIARSQTVTREVMPATRPRARVQPPFRRSMVAAHRRDPTRQRSRCRLLLDPHSQKPRRVDSIPTRRGGP